MSKKSCLSSYVICGEIYNNILPDNLDLSEPPIVLGEVKVDTEDILAPYVLIKYSEFINFTLIGVNPKLNIIYRLIRQDQCLKYAQILQEWEFEFESSNILEIANVDTSQPTVLNYCDSLDEDISHKVIYKLEIIQIKTNNVKSYSFTNESITATVISGGYGKMEKCLPYIKCGRVFNPVLPTYLNNEDEPVVLSELIVDTEMNDHICVLINFSSFVTSILREGRFNNLTFRLVKTCSDFTTKVLQEWPFRRAFVNDTNIKEPLVYNYCECLNSEPSSCQFNRFCTYTLQLIEVELSKESSYNISEKSMTAQIYIGREQQKWD